MGKLSGLADKFKAAIALEERKKAEAAAAEAAAEAERQRLADSERLRLEAARAARSALLQEVEDFCKELSIKAKRKKDGLELKYGERRLSLNEVGDEDRIGVVYEGSHADEHVARSIAGDWLLSRHTANDVRYLMFEPDGLQELFVDALGLPRPGGEEARPEPVALPAAPVAGPEGAPAADGATMSPVRTDDAEGPVVTRQKPKGTPGGTVKDLHNPWD